MKTRTMWFKRAAMLLAMAGCALAAHGVPQRKWEPGITSGDTEFWQLSKLGYKMEILTPKAEVGTDVAKNVVAFQNEQDPVEAVYITYDVDVKGSPVNVSLTASDNGESIPVETILPGSDIGMRIAPGKNKLIKWNIKADYPNHYSDRVKVNVIIPKHGQQSPYRGQTLEGATLMCADIG